MKSPAARSSMRSEEHVHLRHRCLPADWPRNCRIRMALGARPCLVPGTQDRIPHVLLHEPYILVRSSKAGIPAGEKAVNAARRISARRMLITGIMLLIAAAHVINLRQHLQPPLAALHSSYFSDLVMPFGFYFLMCLNEPHWPLFRRWDTKAGAVFLMASTAETLQYLGVPLLGSTFDPLDYAMYAIGAISAAIVDVQVFSRTLAFWARGGR